MALTAREKTEKLLKDNGWELDPDEKVHANRYSREQVQNHNAFIRIKDDGTGFYYLHLEHQRKGYSYSRSSETNTLKSANFAQGPDDEGNKTQIGQLAQPNNWRSRHEHVFSALEQEDKDLSLRDKLNLIIKDPTTAHWLIAETAWKADVADKKRRAEAEADRIARKQPLPLVIPVGGYYWEQGTFKNLGRQLRDAGDRLTNVDGKSDLPGLVAEAHKLVAALTDALTPEAALQMSELICAEVLSA